MAKQEKIFKTPMFAVILSPMIVCEILTITNPMTGLLYYFNADNEYVHGEWHAFTFAANGVYILLIIALVWLNRNKITKIQFVSTLVSSILLSAGALLQWLVVQDVLLTNAFTSLAMLVTYLSLQNPDMFLDRDSDMFNGGAFAELSMEYMQSGKDFSLLYVWIEDFRNLDALYGIENVEAGLKEAVSYINEVFYGKMLYRMEKDAFMIQDMGRGDFRQIEVTLRDRFESPFQGVDQEINFSVGIVIVPYWQIMPEFIQVQKVLEFGRLLAHKAGFGSTVEITDDIIRQMEYENGVERAVERAIAENSIQIYCQPIFSTTQNKITSAEALARLFDEDLGFISPEDFIKKAEANGSIVRLGSQIFEKICAFLKDSNIMEYGLENIHVNLSPIQCMQEDLVKELISITDKYGIERNLIDLEITETAGVDNNKQIRKNMEDLIDERFTFSLDDYGTGYSNTATIVSLPFKTVKIDKSLVWGYFRKQTDILPDIIKMFHNQKLELVMEGVETKEMVDVLSEMGCQYLQGFYYSKPIPQREFVSYLREFNRKSTKSV